MQNIYVLAYSEMDVRTLNQYLTCKQMEGCWCYVCVCDSVNTLRSHVRPDQLYYNWQQIAMADQQLITFFSFFPSNSESRFSEQRIFDGHTQADTHTHKKTFVIYMPTKLLLYIASLYIGLKKGDSAKRRENTVNLNPRLLYK